MARADLLTDLIKFGITGDKVRFRKVAEAIIAEERAKKHTVLADKMEELLQSPDLSPKTVTNGNGISSLSTYKVDQFLQEITPQKRLDDLVLPPDVQKICCGLIEEHHRTELLRSYNLEPRNRILLIGPPGNGKTSIAEAIAEAMMIPLLAVRYEGVVGAYLGETAVRLRRLIEHACTRRCVLFFDEFETLGKERGDTHETGEIKRVVSSLLLQIDRLPSHVVVIGATNHPELLDRAVWRRFQVRMDLPTPSRVKLEEWFNRFQKRIGIELGVASSTLSKKLLGYSFAEVEEFGTTVFRQYVLEQPDADIKAIVNRTLKIWPSRSVRAKQDMGEDD